MLDSSTPNTTGSESPFQLGSSIPTGFEPSDNQAASSAAAVTSLLKRLQKASTGPVSDQPVSSEPKIENQLASVRLGIATSLFYALRTKHAPTAAHGLRVALLCSVWAERLRIESHERDRLEVAALLHDVGKIGIPDRILQKPGKLTVEEQLSMDQCSELGCEILRGCTGDTELLDIVRFSNLWYQSRRHGEAPRAVQIPLGSRMLAIADAFDSMTSEHVYRSAMSRERAVTELIQGAGSQFDPELVGDFARMLEEQPEMLQGAIVDRWLQQLQNDSSHIFWSRPASVAEKRKSQSRGNVVRRETRFNWQLLGTLQNGVAFTDAEGVITQWNDSLERLTGIASDAIVGKRWSMDAIGLQNTDGREDDGEGCPVSDCLQTFSPISQRMLVQARNQEPVSVHVEVTPVRGEQPGVMGTIVVFYDLSDKERMQRRLETLDRKTKMDPLTKVGNRAHFDNTIEELTQKATEGGNSFSLVICDIDHFKSINDVHGHPAGDAALVEFAALLKSHSREGDLVARYGGEEFLLLADNCDNATAAKRGEAIRASLAKLPIQALEGACITASFGVTEFQPGDTAETVLARADRALLKAKDNGRNRVVQLGSGTMKEVPGDERKLGWLSWFSNGESKAIDQIDVLTMVPIDLTIEKLRGFIADHDADVINIHDNQLSLKVRGSCSSGGRRIVDKHISMILTLTLSELHPDDVPPTFRTRTGCTRVHVEMKPTRNRDRRRVELQSCVQGLVVSLNSYLMGEVVPPTED